MRMSSLDFTLSTVRKVACSDLPFASRIARVEVGRLSWSQRQSFKKETLWLRFYK